MVGLTAVTCGFVIFTAPALAALEFSKVGGKIQAKSQQSHFVLEENIVTCEESKGTGEVTSAKETQIKVSYGNCKVFLIEGEKSEKAHVSTCAFAFNPEGTVVIKEGCAIEVSGCVVEQASKSALSETLYVGLKEEESSPATEFTMEISSIPDTVKGSCASLGIKESKEGQLDALMIAGGVLIGNRHKINVKEATLAVEKEYKVVNSAPYEFKFPGTTKTITCGKFRAEGKTPTDEFEKRTFGRPGWEACTNNIAGKTMTLTATTGCVYYLNVAASTGTGLGPFPATGGWLPAANTTCVVAGTAGSCTVTFEGTTGSPDSLTNNNMAPETVTVKEGVKNISVIFYGTNGKSVCPGIPTVGRSVLTGTSIFKGVNAEIKVV